MGKAYTLLPKGPSEGLHTNRCGKVQQVFEIEPSAIAILYALKFP